MWNRPAFPMPYSLKKTGWEPVSTHCCRKYFLVCWPPGWPGKEHTLVTGVFCLSGHWALIFQEVLWTVVRRAAPGLFSSPTWTPSAWPWPPLS